MATKARLPGRGMAFPMLLLNGALLAGASAIAAEPATPGLLQLPNARLETATPQQRAQMTRIDAASQSGVRAYKDPVTGQLRDQTPEEMMEGGAPLTKAAPSRAAKSMTLRNGIVGVELDESFMMNAIASRDANGKVRYQCVKGHDITDAVLNGKSVKEHRHDH